MVVYMGWEARVGAVDLMGLTKRLYGFEKRSWLSAWECLKSSMAASNTSDDEDALNSDETPRGQNQDDQQDGFFEPDDDGSEFSLTQLSEAYAEVIEAQTGVKHTVGLPGDSEPSDDPVDAKHQTTKSMTTRVVRFRPNRSLSRFCSWVPPAMLNSLVERSLQCCEMLVQRK